MKRVLMFGLLGALLVAVVFVGCAKKEEAPTAVAAADTVEQVRVVLYVNGTLGDKSFFDSAARGLEMAQDELGVFGKVVEGGYDPARWEPDIAQLCDGDWDIVIAGTWQLQEYLEKYAPMYPDKYFFTYDTSVDYSKPGLDNVYSILYSQNEASFVTGVLAALVTQSDMPAANEALSVGFLGGMDISVINDFKVGYEEGVAYVNPAIDVKVAYAGAFSDPAKGKELTLAMYDQGADIIFNVAGETGLGGLDAAKERERYALGVDSDQYLLFADSDPDKAQWIVTSMMKNVDLSIYRAIEMHVAGTLPYGSAEVLGFAEGGVGVAQNANFDRLVPAEYKATLAEVEAKIVSGEISVGTAFGN